MTYTQEEQAMMDKGRTFNQAIAEQGGYFQVGNTPFPQAISAEHAVKLYHENFGYKSEPVRKMSSFGKCAQTYDPRSTSPYVWHVRIRSIQP